MMASERFQHSTAQRSTRGSDSESIRRRESRVRCDGMGRWWQRKRRPLHILVAVGYIYKVEQVECAQDTQWRAVGCPLGPHIFTSHPACMPREESRNHVVLHSTALYVSPPKINAGVPMYYISLLLIGSPSPHCCRPTVLCCPTLIYIPSQAFTLYRALLYNRRRLGTIHRAIIQVPNILYLYIISICSSSLIAFLLFRAGFMGPSAYLHFCSPSFLILNVVPIFPIPIFLLPSSFFRRPLIVILCSPFLLLILPLEYHFIPYYPSHSDCMLSPHTWRSYDFSLLSIGLFSTQLFELIIQLCLSPHFNATLRFSKTFQKLSPDNPKFNPSFISKMHI